MAKGKTAGADQRGPPPLPNRDVFHRINFAYQSAAFFQHLSPGGSSLHTIQADSNPIGTGDEKSGKKRKRKAVKKADLPIPGEDAEEGSEWGKLARKGTREMKKMAVHTQIKMDPSIKRAICKTCSTVLIPGLTCRVRNRPSKSHTHVTHYTCLACQTIRSIPNPPLTPSTHTAGPAGLILPEAMTKKREIKAAFHEREQVSAASTTASAPGQRRADGEKGHSMWRGDKGVMGWGAVPHLPDLAEIPGS